MSSDPEKMMAKADKMYAFFLFSLHICEFSSNEVNDRWM